MLLAGCSHDNATLKHAQLSVAYVINPRLPQLPATEIKKIIARVAKLTSERFSLELQTEKFEIVEISQLFDKHKQHLRSDQRVQRHILKAEEASKALLFKGFLQAFENMPTRELIAAVQNQTNAAKIDTNQARAAILKQVAHLHIDKLMQIKAIQVESDGKNLLQDDLFNEYMAWDYILEHQSEYDVIITNQIVASAETYYPTVHTSMRGGITSGFAGKSKARYGGTVLMTTFPFTSQSSFFSHDRGKDYSPEEIVETIAFVTTHEFGHLFKYRKHYYDHPGCIMRPAPGLHYLEWVNEIKANGKCHKYHEPYWKSYYAE